MTAVRRPVLVPARTIPIPAQTAPATVRDTARQDVLRHAPGPAIRVRTAVPATVYQAVRIAHITVQATAPPPALIVR